MLDASTAIYSLHLKGVGSQFEIRDAADQPVTLEVVGLLKNSVLQGNLLVSEDEFFADVSRYRRVSIFSYRSEPNADRRAWLAR